MTRYEYEEILNDMTRQMACMDKVPAKMEKRAEELRKFIKKLVREAEEVGV